MLPNPKQTYKGLLDPRLAVTQFDRNFRQRQRYTENQELIEVAWLMDQFQYDLFKYFVDINLKGGSLEFNVNILGLDGLENRSVRIQGGKHSMSYRPHGYYDITATLIVKPATLFDGDTYEFLLTLEADLPDAFITLSDILSLYIEGFFGESSASPEVLAFLESYS